MAQLMSVKLSRFDSAPWGFRLQGGKDFGQPLVIQKVNGNSLAEKAGLQAGDALIKVNTTELFNLAHKEAQNALVRAGNSFELVVQRGGSTWKPSVTPVGPTPSIQSSGNIQPVTKTSLAHKPVQPAPVANQYNFAPKPFGGAQVNGESIKSIASKQYNTPVGLYSEENIAETLSAQAEVLAGGVLGVNFKKNEKTYNAANSEVLKMVQEIDSEPREPEPDSVVYSGPGISLPTTPKASNVPVTNPLAGLRHVQAPEPRPTSASTTQDSLKVLPPGQNICADCERLIVGLFVRIKDKNLHVECFKCATCGTSLKNVGYYNISGKLYCDVHAKLVARQNPPGQNLEPITIAPGGKTPSAVIASSIAAAPAPYQPQQFSAPPTAAPSSPQPGTLAPLPFHAPYLGTRHVSAPRSYPYQPHVPKTPVSQVQAPKPMSLNLNQPAAIPTALGRPQSGIFGGFKPGQGFRESVQEGNIQYQSYSTLTQSAYEAKRESVSFESRSEEHKSEEQLLITNGVIPDQKKKMSICSQEIGKMHMDAQSMVKHLTEILEDRCPSPTPSDEARKLASNGNGTEKTKDEQLQQIEQEQQWSNYQTGEVEIINKNLKIKETGVAFLRSHSTPVAELEERYNEELNKENQDKIDAENKKIANETRIKEIEDQIIESQKQIIEKQEEVQNEIEKRKHVRFEEEEEAAEIQRRQSIQMQQNIELEQKRRTEETARIELEQKRRTEETARIELEQKRRAEETARIEFEQKQRMAEAQRKYYEQQKQLAGLEMSRERARTPVADMEAYERDETMSVKTKKIYHTYEHLVEDEIQAELADEVEIETQSVPRPVTPARYSPYPGSISMAEKSLLLKNIQGIEFEFEQAKPRKPEPKIFKLPDLRNLGKSKPLSFTQEPTQEQKTLSEPVKSQPIQLPTAEPVIQAVKEIQKSEAELREEAEFEEKQRKIQEQLREVEEKKKQAERDKERLMQQKQALEQSAIDSRKQVIQQEMLQHQQIKHQRSKVHEELALNERFRKKQEILGVPQPGPERSKTPVAELEEIDRHHQASDRTKIVSTSYDHVFQAEERPRSRIGQPAPEYQAITDAEKSLFFHNIRGINYEFENISELSAAKHLPESEKSQFIRTVETRTKSPLTVGINNYTKVPISLESQPPSKPEVFQSAFVHALTTMPDSRQLQTQKSYEEYRQEQEIKYQQQKVEQQKYFEQQQKMQLKYPSQLVSALTVASDRPYSPLSTAPATIPQKVPLPEQTAPYIPHDDGSMIDALTVAPEKPFSAQVFDAGNIESAITNTTAEKKIEISAQRRPSLGFPGVNVQRTPYQMRKGSQISTAFHEELQSQETAVSMFTSKTTESSVKEVSVSSSSSSQETSRTMQAGIAPGFGLVPTTPQMAYAPLPPPEKRAELLASQAKFGTSIIMKPEKPKQEMRPLSRPITMIEALSIASDRSYSPFPDIPRPQATLVHGGSAVALTKPEIPQKVAIKEPSIEVKPLFQIRDLQLSKDSTETTKIEQSQEKKHEAGVIKGEGITGAYQKSVETKQKIEKIDIPSVPPTAEQCGQLEIKGFPPVTQELQTEYSSLQQQQEQTFSEITKKNEQEYSQSQVQQEAIVQSSSEVKKTESEYSATASQQSLVKQSSEKVTRSEDQYSVTERRVYEVVEAEHSHKESTQIRVIGGSFDPHSGLRRTGVEGFTKQKTQFGPLSSSGLHKPATIPPYQASITDKPAAEIFHPLPVDAIDAKNFQTGQRRARTPKIVEKSEPVPEKVPLAFRSRTPIPLPKINYASGDSSVKVPAPAPKDPYQPTYNQTEVYRSASPRPIHVPKQQFGVYSGQPQKQLLQATKPTVYRSTSPVPVPKFTGTTEKYQQPMTRRTVTPKDAAPRVSWPPQSQIETPPVTQYTPKKLTDPPSKPVSQESKQASKPDNRRVSWPPQEQPQQEHQVETVGDAQLEKRSSQSDIPIQNIVKTQIDLQEQAIALQQSASQTYVLKKTNLQGKVAPGPKPDPIVAPRPFGTPTPQRKIATPHFQPIKPVAITQCQSASITAPKLTFSSSRMDVAQSNVERKTSFSNSSGSAFAPIDVSPVKPTPFKPINTTINPKFDMPSLNGLANKPDNVQKPIMTQNIQKSVQDNKPILPCENIPNKQASEVDKSRDSGGQGGKGVKGASFAGATAPRRGRGVLNPPNATRVPLCGHCNGQIRGPFVTALGKIWCPDHFVCTNAQCRRPLADIGFVEEENNLYCEFCFEKYIAPNCDKCSSKIKGDCLNAIGKHFHPECFNCAYCGKLFGNSPFFLEDGLPYCEADWNELFTTKCFACGFPIEAGDRWVEALNNNYHSQCFNCTMCKKNLEGQSFYAKGGRPFCKTHAR